MAYPTYVRCIESIPESRVSNKHTKTSRRRCGIGACWTGGKARFIVTGTVEVVDSLMLFSFLKLLLEYVSPYASLERNKLKLAVTSMMIQLRLPVVAVIEFLVACGVTRVWCFCRTHGLVEPSTTDDGVHMARVAPGTDNGIRSLD